MEFAHYKCFIIIIIIIIIIKSFCVCKLNVIPKPMVKWATKTCNLFCNTKQVTAAKQVKPLSPNSDQQQFSPNNVHTLSRDKVVRI